MYDDFHYTILKRRLGSKENRAMMKNPRLVKPSVEYMGSYIAACREYAEAGLEVYDDFHGENPTPELIKNLLLRYENESRGIGLPEGWVPSSTFWLVDEDEYIGAGNIRYALTEQLKKFGGHIGYEIRPSKWEHGYGTLQLKLLLSESAKLGIRNALVTCSAENVASARVIEKNGGLRIDCISNIVDGHERMTCRYRIDTGYMDGDLYSISQPWYHGSNAKYDTLLPGSTITQWKELAEAFSHKPTSLSYGDDKVIRHNGIQPGLLYIIDEPVVPGEDIYMHPRTTMEPGHEWLTVRSFKIKRIVFMAN